MFTSDEIAFLNKFIEDKARQIAISEINKVGNMKGWYGVVIAVNVDGTCNIQKIGDATILQNIINDTGLTLNVGDSVELHSIGSLTNASIRLKK